MSYHRSTTIQSPILQATVKAQLLKVCQDQPCSSRVTSYLEKCVSLHINLFSNMSLTAFQTCKKQLHQRLFLYFLHKGLLLTEGFFFKGDQPRNCLIRLYYS